MAVTHPFASPAPTELFQAVLDSADTGVVVVDPRLQPLYANQSSRRLLAWSGTSLPAWVEAELNPMIARAHEIGRQVVATWQADDLNLRARVRIVRGRDAVLELTIASASNAAGIEQMSRSLGLSRDDSRLLVLLWRGLSNEEIARELDTRVGTIKSRLFRLYQRLGVKRRAAAVLRAAEVLGAPGQ